MHDSFLKYFVIKFITFVYSYKNIFSTSKYANKPNMRNILNLTVFKSDVFAN